METPYRNRHIQPVPEQELDPRLAGMVDYWRGKISADADGATHLPGRAAIDPLDFRALLGHVLLVDVLRDEAGARRYRYRLFGTEFVFYHGGDLTGRYLDEISNAEFRAELLAQYDAAVTGRQPQYMTYDYIVAAERHRFHAVLLPLAADGVTVDMVLGCGVRVAVL